MTLLQKFKRLNSLKKEIEFKKLEFNQATSFANALHHHHTLSQTYWHVGLFAGIFCAVGYFAPQRSSMLKVIKQLGLL